MKRLSFVFSLILCNIVIFAQEKYSNEFLSLGTGARAMGMSNSVVASVDDATSSYWNPAGLSANVYQRQLFMMHSSYFAGIANYNNFSFSAIANESAAIGVSYIRFGVDNIPNTTELIDAQGNIDYDKITSFGAIDNAFFVSYSQKMPVDNLIVGLSAKIIRRKMGDFGGSWGFGFDLGSQYKLGTWKFGAVLRDATTTFNAWSYTLDDATRNTFTLTGNDIPESSVELTMPKLLLGTGKNIRISNSFSIYPELDIDISFDGKRNVLIKSNFASIDPHFGLELGYKNFAFLRGGIGNVQKETNFDGKKITTLQPNFGVGINIKNKLTIDYAMCDIGDVSAALYSHVFSLKLNINKKTSAPAF